MSGGVGNGVLRVAAPPSASSTERQEHHHAITAPTEHTHHASPIDHTRAHWTLRHTRSHALSQTARTHKHEHRPNQTRLCLRECDASGSSAAARRHRTTTRAGEWCARLGRWLGWAAKLTYVALMVAVHGAVTVLVAPSTSCAHCTWLAGGSVRRFVAPLIPARVRVVRPELVCDTHRDAVSVTRKLQYTASDVRVGERCHKAF